MAWVQVTMRRAARSSRKNATGCRRKRQTHMAVILYHLTARGHRAESDGGFDYLRRRLVLPSCGRCEEREGFVAQRLDRPKRFAPDKTQRGRKASASAS